ncbi:LysR family transcriptional regulator [Bradyrhizobium sp. LTSPM299]|uniref:LysR substrate-binding domain-containing protein n=1 Tax=Bradyrhizobium sp. LTSPM299 TaxID=1619233 RepID=UPI0005C82399|nr:LysR substrate-binding domain-containing protein [Bradyrhizobium sp. LTSPM299]KJC57826.1 LysR family transcriptional regulator [Bradyrhizobium sp. LTSPM299]
MDRLDSMSMLVTVVEAGSLSAAARLLDTPLTTVSRKISVLEEHLKTQLLTRSSRRISLTDAGRSYVAACKRILEDVGEAERIAAGEYTAPKGELSVTAPIVFGRLHLVPVLADFLRAYPDIDVRLTLSNRQVNLTEEGIDAALRVGDLPDSAMIATRVGTIRRVFAASPLYLKARGIPRTRADLIGHDCIGVQGFTGSDFWSVADDGEIPVRYRLIVNSTDAACEAAKEGMGIVSVFSHHVASNFQDGTLVSVLPDFKRQTLPLSLVRGAREYLPLKLRAFLDFATPRLKARLAAEA